MLRRYLSSIKTIFKEFVFDVYILSYKTKKIVYITSTGTTSYIVERICGNDVVITKIKRIYAWELKKFVSRQDAVLVDMHKLFARFFNDGYLVPPFVRQVLDIDKSIEDAIRISNKELKKVYKYSYDISKDMDDLKFFYEKMHVPYIKKRYGDSAYIEDFNSIKKILEKGELLLIKLNGEYVSGALCGINGDEYYCRRSGVLDESFIKKGALITTYYFPILRAKERNAKIVDFGQSRPFLLDGVLRHKCHWGTRICEDKTINRIIYLRNILEQPFIYIDNKKLRAIIFSKDDKLIKEYARSGLEFNIITR